MQTHDGTGRLRPVLDMAEATRFDGECENPVSARPFSRGAARTAEVATMGGQGAGVAGCAPALLVGTRRAPADGQLPRLVDFVVAQAKVGGSCLADILGVPKDIWPTDSRHLAAFLRGVKLIGEAHLGAGADRKGIGLGAVTGRARCRAVILRTNLTQHQAAATTLAMIVASLATAADMACEARRVEAILTALDGMFMDCDAPGTAAANTITHELVERMGRLADRIERLDLASGGRE